MEKDTIIDNLDKLLMGIHRQVVLIRDAEGKVPKIEMDKTLSDIRALYEQFTVLNYLNTYPDKSAATVVEQPKPAEVIPAKPAVAIPAPEKESPFVPIVEKQPEPVQPAAVHTAEPLPYTPPVIEKEPEPVKPVTPPAEQQPYIPPTVEKQPEPVKPATPPPVEQQPYMPPVVEKQPEPVKPVIPTPVADEKYQPKTVQQPERAVEKVPIPEANTLADKMRLQKLDDLYKGVSISDKFLYMNELFEGENGAYKEAMDMLNRLTSHGEAERYMQALAQRFGWDEHPKAEKKFRELVLRKFV